MTPPKPNITKQNKELVRLIERSPDIGDGWRQCTEAIWPLVVERAPSELVELDPALFRIRFSERGLIVKDYL